MQIFSNFNAQNVTTGSIPNCNNYSLNFIPHGVAASITWWYSSSNWILRCSVWKQKLRDELLIEIWCYIVYFWHQQNEPWKFVVKLTWRWCVKCLNFFQLFKFPSTFLPNIESFGSPSYTKVLSFWNRGKALGNLCLMIVKLGAAPLLTSSVYLKKKVVREDHP